MPTFQTTAFYYFIALDNIKNLQTIIQDYCDKKSLKGTILIAHEGINGTISGKEKDILSFHEFIKKDEKKTTKTKTSKKKKKIPKLNLKKKVAKKSKAKSLDKKIKLKNKRKRVKMKIC